MSVSVKELCELMNVSYDRAVVEAIARVSNEEEDSLESDSSQTAANEDSLESDNENHSEIAASEHSLEHNPENDPDYTPVNEDTMWMAVWSLNYYTLTTGNPSHPHP
ncbi:uncharacterized protein LOC143738921 [Siphateles boraxobius]|uniref:uncharacterized protein LOC143738921 n=1 Tax=Siphateles boraxobius TaxID=180520 RepID=UPI0040630AD2